MTVRLLLAPAAALLISGCNMTGADEPDPTNPFHCGVAFSILYGMAKSSGSPHEAMMYRRMTWEAQKAGALPASERSREEGEALMKRLMADQQEVSETAFACMQRQDQDPSFRTAQVGQ
jgi:hypothetical protein